jgi:hypothetical protein
MKFTMLSPAPGVAGPLAGQGRLSQVDPRSTERKRWSPATTAQTTLPDAESDAVDGSGIRVGEPTGVAVGVGREVAVGEPTGVPVGVDVAANVAAGVTTTVAEGNAGAGVGVEVATTDGLGADATGAPHAAMSRTPAMRRTRTPTACRTRAARC